MEKLFLLKMFKYEKIKIIQNLLSTMKNEMKMIKKKRFIIEYFKK